MMYIAEKYLHYFRRVYLMTKHRIDAYPINAMIGVVTRLCYMLSGLGSIYFSYLLLPVGKTIFGATLTDAMIIFIVFQSCFYILGIFHYNYPELILQIQRGQLDTHLIRPLRADITILFQQLYYTSARDAFYSLLALVVLCIFFSHLSPLELFFFIIVFLTSLLILSSLNLMFTSIGFYLDGFTKGPNWFKDQSSQICRNPKEIYPSFFQWIFFPLFFVVNPIFQILQHRYTFTDLLLQLFMASITFILSTYFWQKGLRRYVSAN